MSAKYRLAAIVSVLLFLAATESWAQQGAVLQTAQGLDDVVSQFQAQASTWAAVLWSYAARLFWMLAGVEFAWAAIMLAWQGQELNDWVAMLFQQIMFVGFFWILLLYGQHWAHLVIESFAQAAGAISVGGSEALRPSGVISQGMEVVARIAGNIDLWRLDMWFVAAVVMICYALIAGIMVMVLVEAYLILGAGMLILGFGPSRWTSEKALSVVHFTVGIGGKYFVLLLLVDLGLQVIGGIVSSVPMNVYGTVLIVACAIILLALVASIPEMVQSMLGGHSSQSGQSLMGAARTAMMAGAVTVGAVKTGAVQTAGAAQVGTAAMSAGREAFAASSGAHPMSRLTAGAGAAAKLMGQGAKGALNEAGGERTGMGRMAEAMRKTGNAGAAVESGKGGVSG